jgi:hypothetical protein
MAAHEQTLRKETGMQTSAQPASLAEVARAATDAACFSFAMRNFLDAFYVDPSPGRLSEEPCGLRNTLSDGGLADAYLAAVAEHLALVFRMPPPAWSRKPDRVLQHPWFAMQTHGARMFLITDSPASFRQRNIFVSADALTRA